MILAFVAAIAFIGYLNQCEAELPAVGKCTFMEYYCTLREYESHFFKTLFKHPTADCGLQFWNLYYLSLKKAETCLSDSKKQEMANIKEIQLLYCSGFDLEAPLMFSLSPCSETNKIKVDQCLKDFATTFSNDTSDSSLCRKRGKAKVCAATAWQTICQYSAIADGIYKKVIGDFNPLCDNDKDPWASGTDHDLCADYRIPYQETKCDQLLTSDVEDDSGLSLGAIAGIVFGSIVFVVIVVVFCVFCYKQCCDYYY